MVLCCVRWVAVMRLLHPINDDLLTSTILLHLTQYSDRNQFRFLNNVRASQWEIICIFYILTSIDNGVDTYVDIVV